MTEPKRRGRPPKARIEGDVRVTHTAPVVVPAAAEDFASFVHLFKAEHPEAWETLRLCPLQHGLEEMTRLLK